ncbi:MAG: YbaB/EbfC family nucleoid-associated protein [Gemmatimonadetes bacterium]|nr:YbaB/EbfC family nucleoid-associated protein [Gemmatimonadota bacterium]MCH7775098.1 YbaB/EbfC family nucleoid-associated protein [Gemmatimonadota bacterium]MCH8143773.1 YbaB/EbfC family nucleoid-associated protein [Gemmatimonadota bacterium]MCH8934244.1 YbaB/EbfC family nucleoid-associated protein [Gemmatimonadota bacterium]MCH8937781.1 YbaB/EbfC family nucleoid-associated protein [Gemmatimonadota bacterium]
MSDFSQLLQLGQQMQGRITQMQTELTQRTVTGSAGGGMVTVTADGKGHVRGVRIDQSIVEEGDVEMIEDLVTAAVADAQRRAEEIYRDELRKVTGGLQLPFQLPL